MSAKCLSTVGHCLSTVGQCEASGGLEVNRGGSCDLHAGLWCPIPG